MPPLALASLLQEALPWLSSDGRAVLNTLVCNNGRVGSAQALCRHLGLRSRYQLHRLLRREGLPPYEELSGWVCVLHWMLRADAGVGRGALLALARQTPIETATSYRLVRRVTGHSWKDLRRAGTPEVVSWFHQRVHPASSQRQVVPRPLVRTPAETAATFGLAQPWSGRGARQAERLLLEGAPYGVAVRGHDLAYITRGHGAAIERLDLKTGRFLGSIAVGCTPTCVTFDPSGARAYVSVQYCDEIAVIDALEHVQIRTLPVPGDPFPLVISPSGRTLFVTTNADRLWALSSQNGRVIGSLGLPATSHHLALHPVGDRLYVATRAAGSVLEIDANRLKVIRTFALGGWTQGIVVSADGSMLYVANEQHALDAIQLGTGKRVARIETERGAVALALSPDQRLLYAGHARDGIVGVVDVASLTHRGTLVTGGRPGQIAFDPAGRVLISNEAGWVDILPLGVLEFAAA
ncbi:MAG TPA: YncE family protein [Gemmatimonadales bacterium]|nr:YncE family protein [Gemmatimonadales bacterium]